MGVDSNHRSNLQQIYSLSPLATREPTHMQFSCPENRATTQIGFEPTTSAVTGRRSNQLSHRAIFVRCLSAPSKPHTEDLLELKEKGIRSSVRPISNSQLHILLCFHLCPINLVVFKGSHGYLILRGASRLDAFSVYPFRTWLPGYAIDMTTGAPAVRPSRSSRTKDSSSQISYARAR